MRMKAKVLPDGVELETDICGNITSEFIEMKSKLKEQAIHQWLIGQGWTPPKEVNVNKFTKGGWEAKQSPEDDGEIWISSEKGCWSGLASVWIAGGSEVEAQANAQLIAAAGTSANKLAEVGYDVQKLLEMLPQLVHSIEIRDWYHIPMLLDKCRGDK